MAIECPACTLLKDSGYAYDVDLCSHADSDISAQAHMSDIARENAMSPRGGYTLEQLNDAVQRNVTSATRIERERCLGLVRTYGESNELANAILRGDDFGDDRFAPAVPATTDITAERE